MATRGNKLGIVVIKKKCRTCGKEFETVWPRQVYCSEECQRGSARCVECGREFLKKKGTTGQFCSLNCWYEHYRKTGKQPKTCPNCGKAFHGRNKTCSKKCGYEWRRKQNPNRREICEQCDKPIPPNAKPSRRFCSRSCAIAYHAKHGGEVLPEDSRREAGSGYIRIKKDGKWVQEHRYIIERMFGRPLLANEHVHHKNSNRSDNRPENLELWSIGKDPPGQRELDRAINYLRSQGWEIKEPEKEMLMEYEKMSRNDLFALSQKVSEEEKKKILDILAKRPPTQVLSGAGGIKSEETIGKL